MNSVDKAVYTTIFNWLCSKHATASPAMRMAIEALVKLLQREFVSGG